MGVRMQNEINEVSCLIMSLQDQRKYYIQEFFKCKYDFHYFAKNYIILELVGGDKKLKPYDKQLELTDCIQENKHVIVLKTRQTGISTITQAYCTWLSVFYDNVVIGVTSKSGPEATSFNRIIRGMIEKLPSWMFKNGKKFSKYQEQEYVLTNGSTLYAQAISPSQPEKTLRGKAVTFLVMDEAAFTGYIERAWTGIVPALATNQKHARENGIPYGSVILSTPNKTVGMGAWFYNKWSNAKSGTDFFTPFTIYWKDIPELANDPYWYESQRAALDYDQNKIDQELELKFIPSEGSFLPPEVTKKLQDNITEPKRTFWLYNGEVRVFEDFDPSRFYLVGVDSATEYGSDRSAVVVFDYETLEQVWEYVGNCKVKDLTNIIKLVLGTYTNSKAVIENNSIGNQLMEDLNDSEFSAMLYKEKRKTQGVSVKRKASKSGSKTSTGSTRIVPGLSTNAKTRPLMIDALYTYVVNYPEIIKSDRLVYELIGLVKKQTQSGERVEADEGMHDDVCISASMCFYVRKYDPITNVELASGENNAMSDNFSEIVDFNIPRVGDPMKDVKKRMEDGEHKQSYVDVMEILKNNN